MHASSKARASMFGLAHHAHSYEGFAGRLAGRMYRRAAADVAAFGLRPQARILDVGTGPGILPLRIAAESPQFQLDAVDLSAEMIDRCRQSAAAAGVDSRLTFTVADVAALPFPDDHFDLIISTISQHHWSDPEAGLREISRVLQPGGQAWIYDFRWALNRAQRAADVVRPALVVTRQNPLIGTSWYNPIGRLVITA